ncbi:hypothetical protein CB1_001683040 [Camelus ferus]|nr:hypothetical protein CB1_001683040 [Camelus ferus]
MKGTLGQEEGCLRRTQPGGGGERSWCQCFQVQVSISAADSGLGAERTWILPKDPQSAKRPRKPHTSESRGSRFQTHCVCGWGTEVLWEVPHSQTDCAAATEKQFGTRAICLSNEGLDPQGPCCQVRHNPMHGFSPVCVRIQSLCAGETGATAWGNSTWSSSRHVAHPAFQYLCNCCKTPTPTPPQDLLTVLAPSPSICLFSSSDDLLTTSVGLCPTQQEEQRMRPDCAGSCFS